MGGRKRQKKREMGLTGDDDPIKKIHGEEDVRSWYPPSQVADDIKEIEAMSQWCNW